MPTDSSKTETLHTVPTDIKKLLKENATVNTKWKTLTPLAKNEWICWVTIVKKAETRREHLERMAKDLIAGERRPCCWPGCPHRNAKAAKWFKKSTRRTAT